MELLADHLRVWYNLVAFFPIFPLLKEGSKAYNLQEVPLSSTLPKPRP